MQIRYGNSVEDADYLRRPDTEDRIIDTLVRGDSASLFGLRRIGKSSVMRAIAKQLADRQRCVIVLDVQSIGHLGNFFKEYLKALPRSGGGKRITDALHASQTIPAFVLDVLLPWLRAKGKGAPATDNQDLSDYSVAIGRFIGDQIKMLPLQERPILLVDEVVDLCEHAKKAGATAAQIETLLGQLTYWRKQGMPMLITGSIGMNSWVRLHNIDGNLIRDLNRFDLPPLSAPDASKMVAALARGAGLSWWDEGKTSWLVESLPALYPAIIQYAMHHLQYERPGPSDGDGTAFDILLRDRLMPEFETVFLGQFDERIKGYTPKVNAIRTLLRHVCDQKAPIAHDDFMARLTKISKTEADIFAAMLREDGFLSISRIQGVAPGSPLVRLWLGV